MTEQVTKVGVALCVLLHTVHGQLTVESSKELWKLDLGIAGDKLPSCDQDTLLVRKLIPLKGRV